MARVVAADTRVGDELLVDQEWRRVVSKVVRDGLVEIACDELQEQGPRTFLRSEPVLVRWTVPQHTTALAQDLRRRAGSG